MRRNTRSNAGTHVAKSSGLRDVRLGHMAMTMAMTMTKASTACQPRLFSQSVESFSRLLPEVSVVIFVLTQMAEGHQRVPNVHHMWKWTWAIA